jgi:hypothetical protein
LITLHFGVIDLPYSFRAPIIARGKKRGKRPSGAQTTGDVAGYLENKYHIMEHFYQVRQKQIVGDLEKSLQGALENLLLGAPVTSAPFAEAASSIEDRFKKFLGNREIEKLGYPGIPTKAALRGVNHRLSLNRGARRPSFIDTGLYQSSFKVIID